MAKTAAERKRDERARKRAHLAAVGAAPFNMTMYRGTREALERIMAAGEFEEPAEALTVLIHNVDNLACSDVSQFRKLLNVTSLRSGAG